MFYSLLDNRLFRELDVMNRWMEEAFQPGTAASRVYSPQVNVFRKDDQILVEAAVPGLSQEDLEIYLKDGALVISGERKEAEGTETLLNRIGTGRFQRILKLPFRVDESSLDATLTNGILSVVLAQAEADKPRKIEIKVLENGNEA